MAEDQDKDQKTEQATPQRIQKARADGQVGYSSDFVAGLMLLVATLCSFFAGEYLWRTMAQGIVQRISDFQTQIDNPLTILAAMRADTFHFGIACIALTLPLSLVAIVTGLLQTGFNLSTKPLSVNWEKLSIPSGFKRIFSSKNAVRGGLSLIKAGCIALVCYYVLTTHVKPNVWMGAPTFAAFFTEFFQLLSYLALACSIVLVVAGSIDLAFQRWKYLRDLRMSHYEIKREQRETDGDPLMKARIKRLQAEMSKQRMLDDVPEATVVLRNPTHYAVALKYDETNMEAPQVIAKGADFLAKKIIEVAEENEVPVLERKQLARYLYSNVEIGKPIPIDLYQAIAEIISFVRQMRR